MLVQRFGSREDKQAPSKQIEQRLKKWRARTKWTEEKNQPEWRSNGLMNQAKKLGNSRNVHECWNNIPLRAKGAIIAHEKKWLHPGMKKWRWCHRLVVDRQGRHVKIHGNKGEWRQMEKGHMGIRKGGTWAEEGGHVPRRGGGEFKRGEGEGGVWRGKGGRGKGGGEGVWRGGVRRYRERWG
jgi:hypothetical protein